MHSIQFDLINSWMGYKHNFRRKADGPKKELYAR